MVLLHPSKVRITVRSCYDAQWISFMKQKIWDIYINNCFMQRVYNYGYVEILEKQYINKGYIVRVEVSEVYID